MIGHYKADVYLRQLDNHTNALDDKCDVFKRFSFENVDHKCLGVLSIGLPVADGTIITFKAHIVPKDIPLLLALDVLKKLRLLVNFEDGTLIIRCDDWKMNLVYKMGHVYAE